MSENGKTEASSSKDQAEDDKSIEIDVDEIMKEIMKELIRNPNPAFLVALLGVVDVGARAVAERTKGSPAEPLMLDAAGNVLHAAASLQRAVGILRDQQQNRVVVPTAIMPQHH